MNHDTTRSGHETAAPALGASVFCLRVPCFLSLFQTELNVSHHVGDRHLLVRVVREVAAVGAPFRRYDGSPSDISRRAALRHPLTQASLREVPAVDYLRPRFRLRFRVLCWWRSGRLPAWAGSVLAVVAHVGARRRAPVSARVGSPATCVGWPRRARARGCVRSRPGGCRPVGGILCSTAACPRCATSLERHLRSPWRGAGPGIGRLLLSAAPSPSRPAPAMRSGAP